MNPRLFATRYRGMVSARMRPRELDRAPCRRAVGNA